MDATKTVATTTIGIPVVLVLLLILLAVVVDDPSPALWPRPPQLGWAARTERQARVRTNSRARQRIYYRFTPDGHKAALRSLRLTESDKSMRKQRRQNDERTHDSPRKSTW